MACVAGNAITFAAIGWIGEIHKIILLIVQIFPYCVL